MIFIEMAQFDKVVKQYTGSELLVFLDQLYNSFDLLCDQFGLQKIETVGQTYLACGGLKSAEKKIDARLLNRHHSVRVTDFAMEIINYVKTVYLKNGQTLDVKIGIHTGPVISAVVGEHKLQFSLFGAALKQTIRVCRCADPLRLTVSQKTHHYLELYTNNYSFREQVSCLKDFGEQHVFVVSHLKGRMRYNQQHDKNIVKNFDGNLNNDDQDQSAPREGENATSKGPNTNAGGSTQINQNAAVNLNDSESVASGRQSQDAYGGES